MTNLGYIPEELIAAIATPLAPGALGIVRASGKNCIEKAADFFSRPKALKEAKGNTLLYGWIVDKEQKIDEVMAAVYRAPKSFTGEDMIEIFCHGGTSVVTSVYNIFLKNGFRAAERGEYTFRAYINGKTDLTRAEAVKEIIDSKTDVSRGKAAGRLAGNLFEEIDSIKTLITDTLAAIEVEIEYPEDEETIADAFDDKNLRQAQERLKSLEESWKSEKLYQDGARIVLCGKTNAGKSSLFNALLKEERAIVSDIEGTTRDYLESWVNFEGVPGRLFDTAGLRKTDDLIEAAGVEKTVDLSQEADLILYLVDSTKGLLEEDKKFIDSQNGIPLVIVFNKCDELKNPCSFTYKDFSVVNISAKKSTGIGQLTSLVNKILTGGQKTQREGTALGSERQKKCVQEALSCVEHALEVEKKYSLDALVQDLEDCLDALGEVTGQVRADDVLDSVFSHFCVGK